VKADEQSSRSFPSFHDLAAGLGEGRWTEAGPSRIIRGEYGSVKRQRYAERHMAMGEIQTNA
jgi:hypothetical protein